MPRNISFWLTTEQFRNRSKTVTRRIGWKHIKPGDVPMGYEKGMNNSDVRFLANHGKSPDVSESTLIDLLSKDVIKAISDARDYLSLVADDRVESPIGYERQEEVERILDDFLKNFSR